MLGTQIPSIEGFGASQLSYITLIFGEVTLKNSHWGVLKKDLKIHMMSHIKVCPSTTYHIMLAKFEEHLMELCSLKPNIGSKKTACPPILLLSCLVKQAHFLDTLPNKALTPHTN